MSAELQVKAFIDRILRLKEEQDTLADDIREVYAEAKGNGFDKTAMGQLVAHLRKVEKVGVAAVEEGQSIFDLYLSAYQRATGTGVAAHTHEASQSYAEVKGGQSDRMDGFVPIPFNAETGEITEHEQPETASPTSGQMDLVEAGTGQNCAVLPQEPCTAQITPSAATPAEPEAASPTPPAASGTISPSSDLQEVPGGNLGKPSPDAGAEDGIARAMAANAQSEQAAHHSDDDVPAFLKQERAERQPNPKCQKPGDCKWDHGQVSCWRCNSAPAARESEVA